MIKLIDIYNLVHQYVKASSFDINMFIGECLAVLGYDRDDNVTTVEITISSDSDTFDIPESILKVKEVYVNDNLQIEKYDSVSDPYYYIDNGTREIVFSSELLTTDTLEIKGNTDISFTADSSYTSSTSFNLPKIYLPVVKNYVLFSLFATDKYFNPDKMLYFKREYDRLYRDMKRKSNVGNDYINLGDTL